VSLRHGFVPLSSGGKLRSIETPWGCGAAQDEVGLADVDGHPFADSRGSSTRSEDQAGRPRLAPPRPRHAGENDRCKACVYQRLTTSTEDGLYAKITQRH
jgi:hypothetical protein